jgi:sulfatase-like protein
LHNDDKIKSRGYSTDYFTEKALGFIDSNKDKAFFCYVAYNVPHSPFQVPEKYFLKYKEKGLDDEPARKGTPKPGFSEYHDHVFQFLSEQDRYLDLIR